MYYKRELRVSLCLVCLTVFGCDSYSDEKINLQHEYDILNPQGNKAFCYYIGNVTFPYVVEPITSKDEDWSSYNKKKLDVRLPAFVKAGLLNKELINNSLSIYKYSLTKEGEKYLSTHIRNLGDGSIKSNSYFCFGKIVIENIKDVNKVKYENGNQYFTETNVTFSYFVENIPEWISSVALLEPYNMNSPLLDKGTGFYEKNVSFRKVEGKIIGLRDGDDIGYYL
ncbi:hypothetical protein I2494_00450 [Budviciaceae bacterium BWR-B9]|uniref:Lipoprotein n=1 Tax=Limnobaculum allomyrinae TaxID=2791986 RepID=A0ABS1IL03_9GAMM|nr:MULTISPECIES: hypothetical protein [Limnobaculum]MBK5142201.1 hypothetical protein [Limnobaculum allomyrinae]MBV7690915.1 hypothetical protein [Limnobaculum sp. M2-1]